MQQSLSSVAQRLASLGITLPAAVKPVASYMPFVITGNLVFISGQLPMQDGKPTLTGAVGDAVTVEAAKDAARLCGLHILAQLSVACDGNLDRVRRCVRLGGFVQSADGFAGQPTVINGASDLMLEVFGENGKHARAAVGVNALPLNASVEVDALFEIQ
jgi:enamine deaminase RidA (YjgF/YER057c/UK114 family)